jgi:hypothetical protein
MMLPRFLQTLFKQSGISAESPDQAQYDDRLGLSRIKNLLPASTQALMAPAALEVETSPFLKHFGPLHLALAELIWDNRVEIREAGQRRIFHISSALGLVAVLNLSEQILQMRSSPVVASGVMQGGTLTLRLMPASASMLDTRSAQGFTHASLAALLWHYGQCEPEALKNMPKLGSQILSVRRLPPVDPSSLLLRHLNLVHSLSHQPTDFTQLVQRQDKDEAPFLCADLTSLYLTGCLSLRGRA